MKTKISPAVVGAFVLGGLALAVVGLLSFGGVNLFTKPERFVVYFNESIHGLDLGSPVKLGGVRVGKVVDVNVRYDERGNQTVAAVLCELNKNTIRDASGLELDVSQKGVLQGLVDRGLRAQLDMIGFATGLLFVELDFRDPRAYPPEPVVGPQLYTVVPSAPSTISEFQKHVSEILGDLNQVDFHGLSDKLNGLLADTRHQLDGLDLKGMVEQWRTTGAAFEAVARNPEIPRAVANLNSAITDLRSTLADIDGQVGANGKDMRRTFARAQDTLREFNEAATTLRRFVESQQDLGVDVNETLSRLSNAADSVQRLADFLERNPNALIAGRKPSQ